MSFLVTGFLFSSSSNTPPFSINFLLEIAWTRSVVAKLVSALAKVMTGQGPGLVSAMDKVVMGTK